MKMTTGVITVKAVKKKTRTNGFADLAVGDKIEISNDFNGSYMGAPVADVHNLQTDKTVSKYFTEIGKALSYFDWEE